jgi:drug/metabolite transporter (DMT)-like permease
MTTYNLTVPVCLFIPLILIICIAILATRSRIKFANHIFAAYKTKHIEHWLTLEKPRKRRLIMIVALVSSLGIMIVTLLVIIGAISVSATTLIAYLIFIILGIVSGVILQKDMHQI